MDSVSNTARELEAADHLMAHYLDLTADVPGDTLEARLRYLLEVRDRALEAITAPLADPDDLSLYQDRAGGALSEDLTWPAGDESGDTLPDFVPTVARPAGPAGGRGKDGFLDDFPRSAAPAPELVYTRPESKPGSFADLITAPEGSNIRDAFNFAAYNFAASFPLHVPVAPLTASEALYGFAAWLTGRRESVTLGSAHAAGIAAELVSEFCRVNNLSEPRINWTDNLIMPSDPATPQPTAPEGPAA